jgi:hypothetical protein
MDLTTSSVDKLIVHRIGNKLRNESLKLSSSESPVNEELSTLLLGGYLKGISAETNEYYFHHETDLALNATRFYVKQYFEREVDFIETSRRLATHLYENSLHPNIRQGDLLVIEFDGISFNNQKRRALGIFKSEVLDNYLTVTVTGDNLNIVPSSGINPNLIDKGVLILEGEETVFAVDRFGHKTKFWIDDFLKVKKSADVATCSKMMSFIAAKIAETIEDPLERRRYSESVSDLCENNENLDVALLSSTSQEFVDEDAYQNAVSMAQRRYGLDATNTISVPSNKISRNLAKKVSRLELKYGVSLLLPEGMTLADVQVVEGPDNEVVFTIRMRRNRER